MHQSTQLLLGTVVAATVVTQLLKPKKKVSVLEETTPAIPCPPSYLPFQIDGVILYAGANLAGYSELDMLIGVVREYGSTLNLRGGNQDFMLLAEPADVAAVLAKNWTNYEKGDEFKEAMHDFLGSGIFNADGELWKSQRRIARPHFQTTEFKDAILINKHVNKLIAIIDRQLDANPSQPVELQELFCRFTLDTSAEFLFGETVNALENEESDFTAAFNYAQLICAWRFRLPYWQYFVPSRKFKREIKVLDKFVLQIVDNAIARVAVKAEIYQEEQEKARQNQSVQHNVDKKAHDNTNRDDNESEKSAPSTGHDNLLEHFLSVQEAEGGFSRTYLRDMLLNFLIAGRDTTASLLTWTCWNLVSNKPEYLQKVCDEIDQVVGNRVPTYEDIKKLKYQKQVINESLRLTPPVPVDIRTSINEDVLPSGYYMPAKTQIAIAPFFTHRLKEHWGEDADEFDPDRWGPERVGSIRPFMFFPFLAGPRICIGQNFAMVEAMTTLTRLLQAYRISAAPQFKPNMYADIVLFSRNGMKIALEKRSFKEE